MPNALPLQLDFSAPVNEPLAPAVKSAAEAVGKQARAAVPAFGEEPELPPTWSEGSHIFHTTEKCMRLQSIRRNRRMTGKPGLREHCLNCIDIIATKRRG